MTGDEVEDVGRGELLNNLGGKAGTEFECCCNGRKCCACGC